MPQTSTIFLKSCISVPTARVYLSLMADQARIVFKSMRRDRRTPDICSYTTMLSAYVNASYMEGAEKFLRRIKQDGLEPNVVTHRTLIKGYAKVNNLEKTMEKYDEMCALGIDANPTIFTTIMDVYGRNKYFGGSVVWCNEMLASGIRPGQKAKNVILSLARTAGQMEVNQLVESQTFERLLKYV